MLCKVQTLTGESAITPEDGQKVFDAINPELTAGRPVDLDFAGVGVFASPFFNSAIGQLLKSVKPDDLDRLLKIENLSAAGRDVQRRTIENAKRYCFSGSYRKPRA
jgi:hypothetical protein